MTTNQLLDGSAFLGALILFALTALAVVVIAAGMIVAVVGSIARLIKGRPRDRVIVDHEQRMGLHMPDAVDPETAAKMRAAFGDATPPAGTVGEGLSDEQRRTIRETFGPGGPGVDRSDLDAMLRGDAIKRVRPERVGE